MDFARGQLIKYTPETIPDNLFTKNELKMMGLVATDAESAYILYSEQNREYKLFNINKTRPSNFNSQKFSLVKKDYTIAEILQKRKNAMKIRDSQYRNQRTLTKLEKRKMINQSGNLNRRYRTVYTDGETFFTNDGSKLVEVIQSENGAWWFK